MRYGAWVCRADPGGFENRIRLSDASADRPVRAGHLPNLRYDLGAALRERCREGVAGTGRYDTALLDKRRANSATDIERNVGHDSRPAYCAHDARIASNVD